jgi:hypothetical protein
MPHYRPDSAGVRTVFIFALDFTAIPSLSDTFLQMGLLKSLFLLAQRSAVLPNH